MKNREAKLAYMREYFRNRYADDPEFRERHKQRTKLYHREHPTPEKSRERWEKWEEDKQRVWVDVYGNICGNEKLKALAEVRRLSENNT